MFRTSAWPSVSVGVLMLLSGGLLVLPAVAFLAYTLTDLRKERYEIAESFGHARIDEIVDRLDSELAVQSTLLSVFARSGWLQEDALQSLHRRAHAILDGQKLHLLVLDDTGSQLLNTRVDFGTPLGMSSDADALALARGEARPEVSNFFYGKVAQALVFNTSRAVDLPDGQRRVLILARNVDTFAPILADAARAGWTVELSDRVGHVALRAGPLADDAAEGSCMSSSAHATGVVVIEQSLRSTDWDVCAWANPDAIVGNMRLSQTLVLVSCFGPSRP